MKDHKVITNVEQLTPERLTRIFKNKGYLSQGKVTQIIKEKSQETIGSNVHFLELNFSTDAQTKPASPEIVVKISNLPHGKYEVNYYTFAAEIMNDMPIPICYNATYSEETGLSHIILENISDTHREVSDWGWPLSPKRQYCEKVIDCLAELHAFWWDHPKLKDLTNYSSVFYNWTMASFNEKEILSWFNDQIKSLTQFLEFFENKISGKRIELFKTAFSLFPQLAYERITKENITLLHGDAHFYNFFYPKDIVNDKLKAYLIDWQFWSLGVGGQDLAYMIGMFLYPEIRIKMEKELIKRYYNNLVKFGVKNYSWDECWYDYKFGALLNLYRVHGNWWFCLERDFLNKLWYPVENTKLKISLLTIEDLNCMELLES
jgi:thiamine kinase-like enzyme